MFDCILHVSQCYFIALNNSFVSRSASTPSLQTIVTTCARNIITENYYRKKHSSV